LLRLVDPALAGNRPDRIVAGAGGDGVDWESRRGAMLPDPFTDQ